MADEAEIRSIEEFRKVLDEEAAKSAEPEPEPEPEPEFESGSMTFSWKRAIVKRDPQTGLILFVREDHSYKAFERDEEGRVIAIVEETEEETRDE